MKKSSHVDRRRAMQWTAGTLAVGPALLGAGAARAQAAWPKAAFDAKTAKEVLDILFKGAAIEKSDALGILAPDLAENGGVVPVTVQTTLAGVEMIALLAESNPRALVAVHTFGKRGQAPMTVRMKLAQSQNVTAVARAGGKVYTASRAIRVSIGGCGG